VGSLHELEHVGLRRYGDPIVMDGFERALAHAAAFVAPGGNLMLSPPVGQMEHNLVQFNGQRLFAHTRLAELLERLVPASIVTWGFVIDEARTPRQHLGDPAPLLEIFRGYGLCGVELRRS